jgi:hypothetical protein
MVWVLPVFFGLFFWAAKAFEAALEAGPRRFGRRGLFQAIYTASLAYVLALLAVAATDENSKSLFLFLGFLPLVNAVFDFASIGLTRYCLRRGLRPGFLNALKWSLIDAAGAAVLFAGLVLSAIYTVHYVRDSNGAPLASLNAIFTGIARDPDSYWWLYLTFFSTLVPTLLHLGVACFSFITLAPAPLQRAMAGWVAEMDGNGFARIGARTVLPLVATVAIAMPFLALYALGLWIVEYHPSVGQAFFRLALAFAGWLDPAYVEGVDAILARRPGA